MCLPSPTEKEVLEFKKIYERKFKTWITTEEAYEMTTQLLHIAYVKHMEVELVYVPRAPSSQRQTLETCMNGITCINDLLECDPSYEPLL